MHFFIVFAQATSADPISLAGSSGWAGAGLLGLVLLWVFFIHLPNERKHSDGKDDKFLAALDKMATNYKADLAMIADHCEKEVDSVAERYKEDMTEFRSNFMERLELLLGKR